MHQVYIDRVYGLVNRIPGYSQAMLREVAMTQAIAQCKRNAFPRAIVNQTAGVYVRRMRVASVDAERIAA